MGDRPATAATVTTQDGQTILTVTGEIDLSTVKTLQNVADTIIADGPARLVVDLSDVTFMDSSGIALLLGIANRVQDMELRNPSPTIRRVVELTGLAETFAITP
jgi:anti-anti-sigma factor